MSCGTLHAYHNNDHDDDHNGSITTQGILCASIECRVILAHVSCSVPHGVANCPVGLKNASGRLLPCLTPHFAIPRLPYQIETRRMLPHLSGTLFQEWLLPLGRSCSCANGFLRKCSQIVWKQVAEYERNRATCYVAHSLA